ncbi:FUSC family protein [Lysinibacter sp. HNR]|uniref:FUSC family protein n=1 Tax=Lysinibacter sp. HNR TaxID=3031408 RepID=UPI0024355A2D|nr:FUSC family protein [Lysinibacter sp. HNR]WGD36421.1 FUSC family protein [Lysinibacter sp. HNR]
MATVSFRASRREPAVQAAKTMIAMLTAWFVCGAIIPDQAPIFGAIAALLCVQPNVAQSLTKGVERVSGVVLGVAVAYVVVLLFGTPDWLFILAIVLSVTAGWALRMSTTSANQVAITAILVLALGGQNADYALGRIFETLLGAAIGITINALIAAPIKITPAHIGIRTLGYDASLCLDRLSEALSEPRDDEWLSTMLEETRKIVDRREKVRDLVGSARESLALNPRSSRHRNQLEEDAELMRRLSPIITQVSGMTRALHDNYSPALIDDPTVHGLAEECRRAAHDLRRISQIREDLHTEDTPITSQLPALTSPLSVVRPNPHHWILIGSLLEDLRRVREGIVEVSEQLKEAEPQRKQKPE